MRAGGPSMTHETFWANQKIEKEEDVIFIHQSSLVPNKSRKAAVKFTFVMSQAKLRSSVPLTQYLHIIRDTLQPRSDG